MSKRYFSPYESVWAWIQSEEPRLSFRGKTMDEYKAWHREFKSRLLEFLGKTPERVSLNPEVVESVDMGTYVREKVVYDSEKYVSVPTYILVPKDAGSKKRPGILVAHGHGRGKADVCGVIESQEEYDQLIAPLNYDYALQFVKRGYMVIAPDWRGFGERASPGEWVRSNRDPCNVNYMACGYLGYNLLNLQIWDGMRTLDYLQSRKEVDKDRIGCAGLSFGGTMTTYLAALDERVKVACISGYLSTIRGDAMGMRGKGNFCGSQYMPGLLTIGDVPDVAGLIAPKPLMIEMGEKDTCFIIEDARNAYSHLERIYAAAGASEHLDCDVHPGGHAWSGAKAFDWFKRWI
jgi:dienelactone hydrolase